MSINILGITPAGSAPTAPQEKITVPVVQEGSIPASAASDPVIELLKQLLPVDNPIGTLLERFRQAAAFSTPAASEEQSFAEVIELLRNLPVDLKTVTADQLRKVIDRLGLRYEPMLQQAFTQRTPLIGQQLTAQNLKAALLQFLATQPPPTPGSPPASKTPGATHTPDTGLRQEVLHTLTKFAQQNLETFLVKQLEVQARTVTTADTEQASSETTRPAAVLPSPQTAQVLTKILTVLEGQDVPQLKSALIQMLKAASGNTEKPVSQEPKQEGLPAREQPLTTDDLKQALSKLNLPEVQELIDQVLAESRPKLNPGVTQRFTASGADEEQSPSVAPQESEATEQPLMQNAKPGMVRTDQSRARQVMEEVPAQPVTKGPLDTDVNRPSPALPVSPGGSAGTVREQAHELLTAIERTQVLNSINGERGQPVTFQIPILLDSQTSTAQFYVEQRPDESRTAAPEDRHYTIVALLELSGLGSLRIDLALYRKNLSVKVTVERSDAEVFANQLLPDLGQALKDRGFALEFLKCERKIQGGTGATELRGRTLPQNVVNLRV